MEKVTEFCVQSNGEGDTLSGRFTCLTQEDVDLYIRRLSILQPLLERRRSPSLAPLPGGTDAVVALCPAS